MLFVDHGILRLLYLNRHRLGQCSWRSAQPAPHQIRALARRGLRTIVNLRGARECGSYRLEKMACERYGIVLVNFKVSSRQAPTREEIRAAAELFERIEYPMLLHCKSGADRTGLIGALYRILKEGEAPLDARRELSVRFGHWHWSDAGILDLFFHSYIEDNKRRPISFLVWVDTVYDPAELQARFRALSRRRRSARRMSQTPEGCRPEGRRQTRSERVRTLA